MSVRNNSISLNTALLWGVILGTSVCLIMLVKILAVRAGTPPQDIESALSLVASTLNQIEKTSYRGDSVKETVYSGIHGMMRTLDPYSQFLEEDAYQFTQEQQEGSFFGIGISFDIRDGQLMVVSPIEGSPAWKLGIKPGDVIVEIEGKSAAGITTSDVVSKLRGEKGTQVNITVQRPGVTEPLRFIIMRDRIELNSVRGGFILEGNIGYVRISEFSSNTGAELVHMLNHLETENLSGLLLDLRFNGGGLLSAAEEVCSLFLKKDLLIVSTKGRRLNTKSELRVKKNGRYSDIPLIVLVNEHSASASEIVAGAIQDHDRGLVVGSPTHGKGLVGSQFATKLGTAVQLTSAQYFTPSGRFIQKPYDIPHRDRSGSRQDESPDVPEQLHQTDMGRKVYGGGGITPDVHVIESALSPNAFVLEERVVFFDFAVKHQTKWNDILVQGEISPGLLDEFLAFCSRIDIALDNEQLPEDYDYIRTALKREFFSVYLGSEQGEKIRVENLTIIREAMKLFPEMKSILTSRTDLSPEKAPDIESTS
ncbi:S41 family peptidase [bacterium]|nr:S41 family peptidase [candidate division CSSED10-310 bacterium]